jgi:hypothetical protein
MQTRLVLTRLEQNEYQTLGYLQLFQGMDCVYNCVTLEPPWLENKNNISCIPAGRYSIKKRHTDKFGHHIHIISVPNRSYILIHPGNYMDTIKQQTEGCILVGRGYAHLNADKLLDITFSRNTLDELLKRLPDKSIIDIIDVG